MQNNFVYRVFAIDSSGSLLEIQYLSRIDEAVRRRIGMVGRYPGAKVEMASIPTLGTRAGIASAMQDEYQTLARILRR